MATLLRTAIYSYIAQNPLAASGTVDTTDANRVVVFVTSGFTGVGVTPTVTVGGTGATYLGRTVRGAGEVVYAFTLASPTQGSSTTVAASSANYFDPGTVCTFVYSGAGEIGFTDYDLQTGSTSVGDTTTSASSAIASIGFGHFDAGVTILNTSGSTSGVTAGPSNTDNANHTVRTASFASSSVQTVTINYTNISSPTPAAAVEVLATAAAPDLFLRPTATASAGSWVTNSAGTDLHTAIDETTFNDADFIRSATDPSADTCKIQLGSGSVDTDEPVVVKYRYQCSSSVNITLVVRLVEGSTTRATWTHTTIPTTIVAASQTLSSGEVASITNWGNLFLEFQATKV
jgi:hypothetical protein